MQQPTPSTPKSIIHSDKRVKGHQVAFTSLSTEPPSRPRKTSRPKPLVLPPASAEIVEDEDEKMSDFSPSSPSYYAKKPDESDAAAELLDGINLESEEEEEPALVVHRPPESVEGKATNLLLLYSAGKHYESISKAFTGVPIKDLVQLMQDFTSFARFLDPSEVYAHAPATIPHDELTVDTLSSVLMAQADRATYLFVRSKPFMSIVSLPGRFRYNSESHALTTEVVGKFNFRCTTASEFLLADPGEGYTSVSAEAVTEKFAVGRVGKLRFVDIDSPATRSARTFLVLYGLQETSSTLVPYNNKFNTEFTTKYILKGANAFRSHATTKTVLKQLKTLRAMPQNTFMVVYEAFLAQEFQPEAVVVLERKTKRTPVDTSSGVYLELAVALLYATKASPKLAKATLKLRKGMRDAAPLVKVVTQANSLSKAIIPMMISPDAPLKEMHLAQDLLFARKAFQLVAKVQKLKSTVLVVKSSSTFVLSLANALEFRVQGIGALAEKYAQEYLKAKKVEGNVCNFLIEPIPNRSKQGGDQKLVFSTLNTHSQGQTMMSIPNYTLPGSFIKKGLPPGSDSLLTYHVQRHTPGALLLALPSGNGVLAYSPSYVEHDPVDPTKHYKRVFKATGFVLAQHARTQFARLMSILSGEPLKFLSPEDLRIVQAQAAIRLSSKKADTESIMEDYEDDGFLSGFDTTGLFDEAGL